MEYLSLIHQYIPPTTSPVAYRIYMIHVTLVTRKALHIAQSFSLSENELRFLEEASMLHDIGICKVDDPEIGCFGTLPYIHHGVEGGKILREAGFPDHARIAETHTGVGITVQDIRKHNLGLPEQDYLPETLIEEIVSFADLFFSKSPDKVWQEKPWEQVQREIGKYGEWHQARLQAFAEKFLQK